jgi:hypothetical protein
MKSCPYCDSAVEVEPTWEPRTYGDDECRTGVVSQCVTCGRYWRGSGPGCKPKDLITDLDDIIRFKSLEPKSMAEYWNRFGWLYYGVELWGDS